MDRTRSNKDSVRPLEPIADYSLVAGEIGYDQIIEWRNDLNDRENWYRLEEYGVGNDFVAAPDGSESAFLLVENSLGGQHRLEAVVEGLTTQSPYVFSIWVKPMGRSALRLELRDVQSTKYGTATYGLEKAIFSNSGDVICGGMETKADGWVRCWAQVLSFGGSKAVATLGLVNDDFAHDYVGDGTSGVVLWGALMSPGQVLSDSMIATTGPNVNQYKKVSCYFAHYPAQSLIDAGTRELLYHIIRSIRPDLVLEIGSYFCGTSEVMARALWENRGGTLITLDPFGAERCPKIISRWPIDLQKHVDFRAKSFMEIQPILFSEGKRLDLVLVDGNHDYEFALFDIMASAEVIKPGGLIIIDNADQVGPYWAAIDFLKANIGWTEVGSSLGNFDFNNPFVLDRSVRASIPDTSVLVLKAPMHVVIAHQRPKTFVQDFLVPKVVNGINVTLTHKASGVLHVLMIYRSWGPRAEDIEENKIIEKFQIADGQLNFCLQFKGALFSKMEYSGTNVGRRSIEFSLYWQGDDFSALYLKDRPTWFSID